MLKKLLLLFLLTTSLTMGQVYNYEVFNQENGLPSSTITAITQDSRNLIWVGTDGAGFASYDGENFKVFNKFNTLEGFFVNDILEDSNKNLLIATTYNNVLLFDGQNLIKQIIFPFAIQKFLQTPNGVYCFSGQAIYLLQKDYTFTTVANFKSPIPKINSFFLNDNLDIFIATDNGIYLLKENRITAFEPTHLAGSLNISKTDEKTAIIGSENGDVFELKYDSSTYKLTFLQKITTDEENLFQ